MRLRHMNTSDKPFKTSVIVDTGLGADRDVKSVREALDMLSHAWPADRRGSAYDDAVRACARALDGQLSVERARDAFSTAAWEAEIFVSDLGRMDDEAA
jgi:hypothetical protein